MLHGVEDPVRCLATPAEGPEGAPGLAFQSRFFQQEQKGFHRLDHIAVIGGGAQHQGIISIRVTCGADILDTFYLGRVASKAHTFSDDIGHLFSFTGTGRINDQYFRHCLSPLFEVLPGIAGFVSEQSLRNF